MDRDQIMQVLNALKLKETITSNDVINLLGQLGVDKTIIENFGTLQLGLDFPNFIKCLASGLTSVEIDEKRKITLSTEYGNTYLINENGKVAPIEVKMVIENGNLWIATSYDSKSYENNINKKRASNFEICTAPYGEEKSIKCNCTEYVLSETYDYNENKKKYHGDAYMTLIQVTTKRGQVLRHDISMSNEPTLFGFSNETLQQQLSYLKSSVLSSKDLVDINLLGSVVNWNSVEAKAFVNSERIAQRSANLTNVVLYKAKGSNEFERRFTTPLYGEYNMALLLNNSSSYETEEEALEQYKRGIEDGYLDRQIEQYRSLGTENGEFFANEIEQLKETLSNRKTM